MGYQFLVFNLSQISAPGEKPLNTSIEQPLKQVKGVDQLLKHPAAYFVE
jgi:hypothetical protein